MKTLGPFFCLCLSPSSFMECLSPDAGLLRGHKIATKNNLGSMVLSYIRQSANALQPPSLASP